MLLNGAKLNKNELIKPFQVEKMSGSVKVFSRVSKLSKFTQYSAILINWTDISKLLLRDHQASL